jgi:hypothetical protein
VEGFELFLVRYVCERFLYRLGASQLHGRCILKGAGLLTLWMQDPYRMTRDVDLLASGDWDEDTVRDNMEAICQVPCPEDGIDFDLHSLLIEPIRQEQRFAGHRATITALIGKTRVRLQVDFGLGDYLASPAEEAELPTLIDRVPAPKVLVYSRAATVAEKFEAMIQHGRRNSRMKDFHDVWALSEEFDFDGAELRAAVSHCFTRRGRERSDQMPSVLTPGFYEDQDLRDRWRAYLRKGNFRAMPPGSLSEIGIRIRDFLGVMHPSPITGDASGMHWPPGGPWQRTTQTGAEGESDG